MTQQPFDLELALAIVQVILAGILLVGITWYVIERRRS